MLTASPTPSKPVRRISFKAENFIRCSRRHSRYLEDENGNAYIPNGLNICFPRFATSCEDGLATMCGWLDRLAKNNGNYARIFLGHPFFDIEEKGVGIFDEEKARRFDRVLDHAWGLDIRLKLTLELFRNIEPASQPETFPGAINFSRPVYHKANGGLFENTDEYFQSATGKTHFLRKLDWLAERYRNHPGILGWDLWNEVNAVRGNGWQEWTTEMLPELKRRFPNHLVMQNLGSLDADYALKSYLEIMPLKSNEVAQVHRYFDMGAHWNVCHGPIDVMMADAVSSLRRIATGKPVLLAEGGAVEPSHARPWDHYGQDKEGIILHDILFAAFFSGAAGSGHSWHWHEYVDKNNLWWHFKRFSRAIGGIDPILEQFTPCRNDSSRLRVYTLRGKNSCLAWCRDATTDWRRELMDGTQPEALQGEKIELPVQGQAVTFYDPWTDHFSNPIQSDSSVITLPSFQRSIVVRMTTNE